MELNNRLIGYQLFKIQKQEDSVKLIFENKSTNDRVTLSFKGLLFETPTPLMNKSIARVELRHVLGFKALTQIRQLGFAPENYKQLLIQFEGADDEYKAELICVFEDYKLGRMVQRKPAIKTGI